MAPQMITVKGKVALLAAPGSAPAGGPEIGGDSAPKCAVGALLADR
jgi:hypothetical protein